MVTTRGGVGGVLAIDAGNSKTDVVLVAADGSVRGSSRGAGFRPHAVGPRAAVADLEPIVREAAAMAGIDVEAPRPWVAHVSACLANADLPSELDRIEREFESRRWGVTTYIGNDTFALLRAGIEAPPGVAVVCGAGINCSGLLPDGRTARFAAVGKISGDWGGGEFLAEEALWWAARADDGRGPETSLSTLLPAHFGSADMAGLIEALHLGDIPQGRWHEATPILFTAAADGDEVAASVVRRQADEIVALAVSALRRLDLLDAPVDVVLGGGVVTAGHRLLLEAIDAGLSLLAPKALARVVSTPPVVGAALLGLDRIAAEPGAHARLRRAFGESAPD
jgi:N-acetylglucosamine kinase-like BadF-type ATPase